MPDAVLCNQGIDRTQPHAGLAASVSDSVIPVSGFATLMRDSEDLRAVDVIFFLHHGVGKAIEVVDAKAIFTTGPTLLVLDQEISYAFVLCKERQRNHCAETLRTTT